MGYVAREIDAGGRRTRVLEAGRGQALLLIHAFPLTADLWRPQLETPPEGWRVIAPDVLGPSETSMDHYAAHVEAVASALGLGPVVLGGLSMGGYIAFALLRRARLAARAIVLADTRAEADTDDGRAGRKKMIALADAEGAVGVAREMLPKLVGATTHRERPNVVAAINSMIASVPAAAIKAALTSMMARPDSTPQLAAIDVPTLVVVGEEDVLTPPADAETLARGIRKSRLARIPQAGHLSSLERPDVFAAELARFLTDV
jgi:3-oxoadipate enol-lactonase